MRREDANDWLVTIDMVMRTEMASLLNAGNNGDKLTNLCRAINIPQDEQH